MTQQADSVYRQQLVEAAINDGATPEQAERMADDAVASYRQARAVSSIHAQIMGRLWPNR